MCWCHFGYYLPPSGSNISALGRVFKAPSGCPSNNPLRIAPKIIVAFCLCQSRSGVKCLSKCLLQSLKWACWMVRSSKLNVLYFNFHFGASNKKKGQGNLYLGNWVVPYLQITLPQIALIIIWLIKALQPYSQDCLKAYTKKREIEESWFSDWHAINPAND